MDVRKKVIAMNFSNNSGSSISLSLLKVIKKAYQTKDGESAPNLIVIGLKSKILKSCYILNGFLFISTCQQTRSQMI